MKLYAPRILNDPVRCRYSGFNITFRPVSSLKVRARSEGVGRTMRAIRFAASSISSIETI